MTDRDALREAAVLALMDALPASVMGVDLDDGMRQVMAGNTFDLLTGDGRAALRAALAQPAEPGLDDDHYPGCDRNPCKCAGVTTKPGLDVERLARAIDRLPPLPYGVLNEKFIREAVHLPTAKEWAAYIAAEYARLGADE